MLDHLARVGHFFVSDYAIWLFGLGLAFFIIERIRPVDRGRPAIRRGFGTDLAYLVLNGVILGVVVAAIGARLVGLAKSVPPLAAAFDALRIESIARASAPVQFAVAVVVIDLLHWSIHRTLHTVPVLWRFHKVHHSIVDFDWIGSIRVHFVEIIFYGVFSYFIVSFFGFSWPVLFAHAVFTTLLTFYAHSNTDLPIGPLRWVINNPRMHRWHHAHPECGMPIPANFAISLAVWDWIFGTAYIPDGIPHRLGFAGIERYPADVARQFVRPFVGKPTSGRDAR